MFELSVILLIGKGSPPPAIDHDHGVNRDPKSVIQKKRASIGAFCSINRLRPSSYKLRLAYESTNIETQWCWRARDNNHRVRNHIGCREGKVDRKSTRLNSSHVS